MAAASSPAVLVMVDPPVFLCIGLPHSVQIGLALRPRLPTSVDPDPLLGILANNLLDYLGEFLGIHEDVALGVAGANQLHGWFKAETIFLQGAIPIGVARNDRGIGV